MFTFGLRLNFSITMNIFIKERDKKTLKDALSEGCLLTFCKSVCIYTG